MSEIDPKQWEADHQRRHLEALGLADEFPFDCDSIQHVGEALLAARERIAALESRIATVDAALPKTKDGETMVEGMKVWRGVAGLGGYASHTVETIKTVAYAKFGSQIYHAFRRHPETGLTPEEAEVQ